MLVSIGLESTEKTFTLPFNLVFTMLSSVKSFKILPKDNAFGFISESFALNGYIFVALTNKKLLLPL